MKTLVWNGCYEKSLSGFIVPEAFSHPAKFSLALIEQVYSHMIERGWIQRGDVVGDPFGGVGVGGLVAAYRGLQWIGMELEPKFCTLAELNFSFHHDRLKVLGATRPVMMQGDSRQFARRVQSVVTSPPYVQSLRGLNHNGIDPAKLDPAKHHTGQSSMLHQKQSYGNSPGQIEKLREGDLASVVSSPPYSNSLSCGGGNNIDYSKARNGGKRVTPCREASGEGYGKTEGQIDRLPNTHIDACISSPPYAAIAAGAGGLNTKPAKKPGQQGGRSASSSSQTADQKYGHTEGQISQLSAIATSPPWESNCEGSRRKGKFKDPAAVLKPNRGHGASDAAVLAQAERDNQKTYGDTAGNIGNTKGDRETCSVCGECLPLDLCQNVKIAVVSSLQKAAGAKNIIASTLAGRESRSQKNTKQKSLLPISTCQTPSTTEKKVGGGLGAVQCGADTLGEFKGERLSPETVTNVGDADQKNALLFTINEFQKTKKESGIIDSKHSKPYAILATLSTTGRGSSLRCCARCAESLMCLAPQFEGLALSRVEPPSTQQDTSAGEKEDYWRAMFKVYTQCYLALKPGGYMAIVVKAYVKNRKIVDLPGDTTRLLEHCGFEMVEHAHALLSEKTEHNDLFVGVTVTKRERKSFFRRLYEKDPKNPRIDWETVLFARKPL